jgi:hypothetical protein
LTETITSPALMPALSAGLFACTSTTTAPRAFRLPRLSAISGVTGATAFQCTCRQSAGDEDGTHLNVWNPGRNELLDASSHGPYEDIVVDGPHPRYNFDRGAKGVFLNRRADNAPQVNDAIADGHID